jgi:hypothetical protein
VAVSWDAEWHGRQAKFKLRLLWLFERVGWEIGRPGKGPKPGKWPEARKKRKRRGPSLPVLDILRTRGLWSQVGRFFRDLLHSFQLKDFRLAVRAGLDDPYDTGMLFAGVGPVAVALEMAAPGRVSLQPAFDGAVFEGLSHGIVRLWPAKVVTAVFRFGLSSPAFRIYRALVSHGRKPKSSQG